MLKYLFLSVIFLFLLSTLLPLPDIGLLISILCLMTILCTFWTAKRFVRILGSTFLIFGFVLLWSSQADWHQYLFSFGPMLDLLTLFTLVPILGIPIKIGGYSSSINTIIQKKVKTSGHLYILTSGISYFFSIFMNLATLPMTYYSISPLLKGFPVKHENRFMSRAITRGFAMPLIWAPVTPIVGIVIAMTGVSWVSILPYVIPLSVLGIVLDWYIGSRKSSKRMNPMDYLSANEMAATAENMNNYVNRPARVLQILLAIIIFIVLISIAEAQFTYSFLILVSLMVIPFSFIWSILLKKGREFIIQLLDHFQSYTVSMKDQFFIYLSAGFFISTIKGSHTDELLNGWIIGVINVVGMEVFLILLPLIPLGFAFLGLHPAVSLSLMAGALNPSAIGISPQILTVAMLAGAVSSFLVGPYNATLGLMSNMIKESSYKVSNWNLSFTALYIGFVMVYLFILVRLIA
ncbi:hypothetical protein [Bacillus benzoevorans]|uniref:Uncharacterized protein n=1 Tax=Bacillus benzoevorans TaxID=1456 RepID=A0A7X0HP95_9BACI|nr:hypothetical protein [Bacillus benzoevorans]MBB6444458.1 hypothetical protein [Bacillus benzoevorans]